MFIVIQKKEGQNESYRQLVKGYSEEQYDIDADVKVIGVGGVTVASKLPGEASLTIHQQG